MIPGVYNLDFVIFVLAIFQRSYYSLNSNRLFLCLLRVYVSEYSLINSAHVIVLLESNLQADRK